MPDPIIQVPDSPIDPNAVPASAQSINQFLGESDRARDDFFQQASDAFDRAGVIRTDPEPAPAPTPKPPAPSKPAVPQTPETLHPQPTPGVPAPPKAVAPPSPAAPEPELPPREYDPSTPAKTKNVQWRQLHQLRDAAEERAKVAEEKLQSLSKNGAPQGTPEMQSQFAALKAEHDKVLATLESVAAERSPRFEAQFKPRFDAAMNLAKASAGPEYETQIEQLLALPDTEYRNRQLDEIASNLSGLRGVKFGHAVAEIDRINGEKQSLASKGKELWQQWQAEAAANQATQSEAAKAKTQETFESELSTWTRDVEFFQAKPDDQAHTQEAQALAAQARAIFSGGLELQDLARASLWAAIGPKLVNSQRTVAQENAELKAEIARLRGSEPGARQDLSTNATEEDPGMASMGYGDAIARLVQKEGLLR